MSNITRSYSYRNRILLCFDWLECWNSFHEIRFEARCHVSKRRNLVFSYKKRSLFVNGRSNCLTTFVCGNKNVSGSKRLLSGLWSLLALVLSEAVSLITNPTLYIQIRAGDIACLSAFVGGFFLTHARQRSLLWWFFCLRYLSCEAFCLTCVCVCVSIRYLSLCTVKVCLYFHTRSVALRCIYLFIFLIYSFLSQ